MNKILEILNMIKDYIKNKFITLRNFTREDWKKIFIFIIWDLSGIRFIYEKINPPENQNVKPASTIFIWFISINISCWGIAATKYEYKGDTIENQITNILPVAMSYPDKYSDYETIIKFQKKTAPIEPNIFNPIKTLCSLFEIGNKVPSENTEMVIQCLISNKNHLFNKNLSEIDLNGADLYKANFIKTNLYNADLSNTNLVGANFYMANLKNVKGLTIDQLKNVQTLSEAELSPKLMKLVKEQIPEKLVPDFSGRDLTQIEFSILKPDIQKDSFDIESSDITMPDLSNANLSEANLSEVTLTNANLSNANLYRAKLNKAFLYKANLSGTSILLADLQNAELFESDLSNSTLGKSNFTNANLISANLSGCNLGDSNMTNAILSGANLSNATLTTLNLSNAYLFSANISNSDLTLSNLVDSNLSLCNLSNSKLVNTNLKGANLFGTDLTNCNLSLADLTNVKNLTIEQLKKSDSLFRTILPSSLLNQVKQECPEKLKG